MTSMSVAPVIPVATFSKLGPSVLDHEDALQLFLFGFLGGWIGLSGGLDAFILADRFQIAALADR